MEICAIYEGINFFRVWIKDNNKFSVKEIYRDNLIIDIDNREFDDYEHFWGTYGKFNPEILFKPGDELIAITELTFSNIEKIILYFKD
jgi:hypothetical protein